MAPPRHVDQPALRGASHVRLGEPTGDDVAVQDDDVPDHERERRHRVPHRERHELVSRPTLHRLEDGRGGDAVEGDACLGSDAADLEAINEDLPRGR